jgi:hypothetical protein
MISLDFPTSLHHIGVVNETLTAAVVAALSGFSGSVRQLAREAGIPHSTLVRIRAGSLGATPETVGQLAEALERLGAECKASSALLRKALRSTRGRPGQGESR